MRKYFVLCSILIVSACGGGGSGSGSHDVLSTYVSEFKYHTPSTVYKAWGSSSVLPQISYLKPNSELVFSLNAPVAGASVNAQSGQVTFAENFFGGCVPVHLKWAKTGESLIADACMDKEYLQFTMGLSQRTDGNSLDSVNGVWRYTISKANPAVISLDVYWAYFDRQSNETIFSRAVFPDGSTTNCTVNINGSQSVPATLTRKETTPTMISHELAIEWGTVPVGEYQYKAECTVSLGEQSATHQQTQILQVIE